MKKYILTILLCISTLSIWSQEITVKGTVVDAFDEPLEGIFIKSKKLNKGTTTDKAGNFILENIEEGEWLIFSFIGYNTSSVKAKDTVYVTMDEATTDLDMVVVSASRTLQRRKELPVAISSVSRLTMDEVNPISIDQVLNQKTGVHMIDLGNEQHMMAIRQPISTKSLYLYLEDGIPIRPTGVFNHNALLEMNMLATENIEIIRGPYSSLYGSEAIGGAINYITEKPSKSLTGRFGLRGHTDGYLRGDFKISKTFGKTGVYLAVYKSAIKDGIRDYGDYDKLAVTGKVTHQFSDKLDWSNTLTYVDYFSEMSGSLDEEKFKNEDYSSYHTFTFRDAKALRFNSTLNGKWNDHNISTLSLIFRDNTMRQNPSYRIASDTEFGEHTTGELNDNSFKTFAVYLQHNFKFDVMKSNLIVGANLDSSPKTFIAELLDVYRNDDGVFESYTATGVYKSDYETDIVNTGFYLTGDMEPFDNFKINAGIRYDIYSYDFRNKLDDASDYSSKDAKETFTSITPRIGFAYNFTKSIGLYTNYSVGFIPPSIGDLFRKDDVPLLDPSTFNNIELGGWIGLFNNKLFLDFAVYSLKGKDEVVSVTTKVDGITVRENKNVGETKHNGVEFGINYKPLEGLSIRYNGAYSKHEYVDFVTKIVDGEPVTDYSGNEMPGAPEWVTNAGIDYKPKAFLKGFRIGLEWQHVSEYFTDQENEYTYEGYDAFNARLGYDIKHFGFWMNVMNLSDKLYATRANTAWGRTTYTPGMPRTFIFGVNYKF